MHLKLFKIRIEFGNETKTMHAAAVTEHHGAVMVIDWAESLGSGQKQFFVERVDDKLSVEHRRGLGELLSGLPGLASFDETRGWVLDQAMDHFASPPLDLFRIFIPDGDETYVVATEDHEAVAIWMQANPLGDDKAEVFNVVRAVNDLPEEMWDGVDEMLEQGPAGIATWSVEGGWKVIPVF
ncbi:MAG: hypothetical protein WA842_13375 [Croceibacterium sp.]